MKYIVLLLLITLLICCKNPDTTEGSKIMMLETPASPASAEPYLFTSDSGQVYLSWIEKKDSAHLFKFSSYENGKWTTPQVIAEGNSWFVNWADYPMMVTHSGQEMLAHVLNKSGEGTYAYDVKMFSSANGGMSWDDSFILHDDGKQAEHGFVTLIPYRENILVSWLDGRNTAMEGMQDASDHSGHHGSGAMSLRAAVIDYQGNKIDEWELDNKTCDCCQTSAAITNNGPVVVYRDRSDDEIRDMSIVRWVDGEWTTPKTIFSDNWKIAGCPVNGPRADAIGNTLAIAWFGIVDEQPQVKVIFSDDGGATFDKPIRIDENPPIGRVDLVMLDSQSAMVSWMEGSTIKAVQVSIDGSKTKAIQIATSSEARSSGFPQMTKIGNTILFAWTDDSEKKIKTASLQL